MSHNSFQQHYSQTASGIPGRVLMILIFSTFVAYALWLLLGSWHPSIAGFVADDAYYLLLADRVSLDRGSLTPIHDYVSEVSHSPPLWTLILGLFGTGSESANSAYLITAICALIGTIGLAVWGLRESPRQTMVSALALAACMSAGWIVFVQDPWSEFLFFVFIIGALLSEQRERWYLVAFFCGLAFLTRTAGIAMLVAFLILLVLRRPSEMWKVAGFAIAIPMVWIVSSLGAASDDAYVQMMWRHLSSTSSSTDGFAILDQIVRLAGSIKTNVILTFHAWLGMLSFFPGLPIFFVSLLWLPLIALGVYRRLAARRLDGIFVTIYLMMVIAWPFPDHVQRFLLPIFPILVVQGFLFLALEPDSIRARNSRIIAMRKRAAIGYILMFIIVSFPSWLHLAGRALDPIPAELSHFSHSQFWLRAATIDEALKEVHQRVAIVSVLQEIPGHVPEGECIRANHPQIAMLYSRRITFGPGEGHPCRYHFIMRSQNYYAELKGAQATGEILFSRKFTDGSPLGALLDMGSS